MLNAMIPNFLRLNERQASIKTQSPLTTDTQEQYVSNKDESVFNVGMNNPTKIQPITGSSAGITILVTLRSFF